MDNLEFTNIISELIDTKSEGAYWDFKEEWHSNNASLLHDIICMSNNLDNREAYIIFGVSDDYSIKGVPLHNRKNQQNILDLIRQKPRWAGGYIPEVYVKTIALNNHELDVIIVKQSNNTPFYLLEQYTNKSDNKNITINGGAIYTRKGDTNTPKNSTAELYDTELLWKRRFGLLLQPSQCAALYLRDLDNWERIDGETGKDGREHFFFYYKPNPDYTVHVIDLPEDECCTCNINDENLGKQFYYLYTFCNVCYKTSFQSISKINLFYRDVPLCTSILETICDGTVEVVPPELSLEPYYIKDSLRYLLFEFGIEFLSGNYSTEAKEMILKVVPLFNTLDEKEEFMRYIKQRGFRYIQAVKHHKDICGEAKSRFDMIEINNHNDRYVDSISNKLKENPSLVINFASKENKDLIEIEKQMKIGKMLVDWLNEWREFK